MNSMLHCSQNNNCFKKISCIILAHILCLFYFHIYSPKTKIILKKNYIAKERSTVLNKNFPNNQINSSKKETKNTFINDNLSQNSSNSTKKTIPSKTNNSNKTDTNTLNIKKNTKNITELKNKFKELASQINTFETSSKQTFSLYETSDCNNDKKLQIFSSNQFTEQNNLLDSDIINILKDFLFLPDPEEDVIFFLSLSPKGNFLSLKIEKSNSKKNSEYCIKEIPKLPFQDVLQKHNLKQNILFRIKLTT